MTTNEQLISIARDNLYVIFGSPSHEERMKYLEKLWHPDGAFIEASGIFRTHEEISNVVAKIQGEGFVFTEKRTPDIINPPGSDISVINLGWEYGAPGEKPVAAGLDVITVKDGKVERLYTFLSS